MSRPYPTPPDIRALLGEQFPQLALSEIVPVEEGGDHLTVEVDDLIFRFPRDTRTATKLEREIALLPMIRPGLPVPIPDPVYVGRPSRLYPYPFAGYPRLLGISGEVLHPPPERRPSLARQCAGFLSSLHSFPTERAQQCGIEQEPLPDPAPLLDRVIRLVDPVRPRCVQLVPRTEPYLAPEIPLPPPSWLSPVVSHADLKGEHILLSPDATAISGIIDWTDIALCDPVVDFTGLMIWLGEPFVRQVLAHYTPPTNGAFLDRVLFYARCFAIEQLGLRLTGQSDAPLPLLLTQLHWAFT
jgi:aminoglycoside phosphotransferase (APT) family kinase protein